MFVCVSLFADRGALSSHSFRQQFFLLSSIIVIGILGEVGFSVGVHQQIGAYPIRPPFLMARVIADGPGYRFLRENCGTRPYVVCDYLDRLPVSALQFLWSTDPKTGVFSVAELATRERLSSEQTAFLVDVFRSDPIGVASGTLKNFSRQLLSVGLREFFMSQGEVQSLQGKLPEPYRSKLLRSNIIFKDWILAVANAWYSFVYLSSLVGIIICWVLTLRKQSRFNESVFPRRQWIYVLSIATGGILFNAAICGALSEPTQRYQTRVAWIPIFVITLALASLLASRLSLKDDSDTARKIAAHLPRPIRFLSIGGIGLATDLGVFTIIAALGLHPLIARLGSLAVATLVTWRLNRELTFDRSGRHQHDEAVRYAIVTIFAQGTSYAIFAGLVLTVLASLPQVAIVIGAAIGAIVSYNGHRLLSFAPKLAQPARNPCVVESLDREN